MPAVWTHHYPKNGWRIFSFHCYTMHCTYSLPLYLYPDQLSRLVVTARYLLILVQKYKIISSHLVGAHSGPRLEFSWLMHMLSKRIVAWNELSPWAYWCIPESCMVKNICGYLVTWPRAITVRYYISHLSILLYYISRGITRIFSLPEGYMIHISLPLAINLTNQSHCFTSYQQSHHHT